MVFATPAKRTRLKPLLSPSISRAGAHLDLLDLFAAVEARCFRACETTALQKRTRKWLYNSVLYPAVAHLPCERRLRDPTRSSSPANFMTPSMNTEPAGLVSCTLRHWLLTLSALNLFQLVRCSQRHHAFPFAASLPFTRALQDIDVSARDGPLHQQRAEYKLGVASAVASSYLVDRWLIFIIARTLRAGGEYPACRKPRHDTRVRPTERATPGR